MSPVAPRTDAQNTDWRALIVLMIGAAAIGFAPIFVRLTETGPAAAGFWRLLFALPWLMLLAFRPGAVKGTGGIPWKWTGLAGVFFAADLLCWHYGVTYTSVTNATVLTNLTPVVVTLAAWLMFRERPKRLFVAGLALALAGAMTMAFSHSGARGIDPPLGDLLSAVTAFWYGAYFIAMGQARKAADATRVMLWSTAVGAPLLLVSALLLNEDLRPDSLAGWGACAALGVVHVVGQGAIAWALGRLPMALASVVVFVQPVVAAGLGWLFFGETVGVVQGLGAVIALVGVAIAQRSAAKKQTAIDNAATP
jgi:drug/metabolite transporter (DMT)-like permease